MKIFKARKNFLPYFNFLTSIKLPPSFHSNTGVGVACLAIQSMENFFSPCSIILKVYSLLGIPSIVKATLRGGTISKINIFLHPATIPHLKVDEYLQDD